MIYHDDETTVQRQIKEIRARLADVALARRLGSPQGEVKLADGLYAHLDGLGPRAVQELLIAVLAPAAERDARREEQQVTDYVSTRDGAL